jgi:(2Fe-2S) ferredoxin
MRTHDRHVFMCTGPRCTEGGAQAEIMFRKLGEAIDARPELRVKRTRSNCFAICKDGPILVVYPDGVWYRRVDDALLKRIVTEHLEGGAEVTEHVMHRVGQGDITHSSESSECTISCPTATS